MSRRADRWQTRAERLSQPLATAALEASAEDLGVCTRQIPVRLSDLVTGESSLVWRDCGATLESVCSACATKARRLRLEQIREGWHLADDPLPPPLPPTEEQRRLAEQRSTLAADGASEDEVADVDAQLAKTGARGKITATKRTARSTKRRADANPLPGRAVADSTTGRTFEGADGQTYRPSLFWTATLPSYGPVRDGAAVDPSRYDYRRAARDAIHFGRLVDRTMQNLRRVAGWDVQYVAAVEPQKRGAPHVHVAMRGVLPRADLREVLQATYVQVWWPPCDDPVYELTLPVFDADAGAYLDSRTRVPLPTWEEALAELEVPCHVARWGVQSNAQGVLAGTQAAEKCLDYLGKYLTKDMGGCHGPTTGAQRDHVARLLDVLRFEPCSPGCANWLRFGVQPKGTKDGLRPGYCRRRAHRPEHLGYGGRRVLVSRRWSGKTLADHKRDRRRRALELLGITDAQVDPDRYAWTVARRDDPDVPPQRMRLMQAIADKVRQRDQIRRALEEQQQQSAVGVQCSATQDHEDQPAPTDQAA